MLGIESSCDETGVGIVRGETMLANVVASSMDEHVRFGGVVPEIASRAHLEAFVPALREALDRAGVALGDLDAIAVTSGPGLAGAVMVGLGAAKALASATGKPLYGINHLDAHVAVAALDGGPLPQPLGALLVSGGHTELLQVDDLARDVTLLGSTIDDAAGEAYDKVARVLGLPYPGGPEIDRAAAAGDPAAIHFPRGLTSPKDMRRHRYDFSFSGLKTAVARWVEEREAQGLPVPVADVAASFQESVADVLSHKAVLACREQGLDHLLVGGGVAANSRIRALVRERAEAAGIEVRIPPVRLCTDNGVMIAALGARVVAAGLPPSDPGLGADTSLPVELVHPIS